MHRFALPLLRSSRRRAVGRRGSPSDFACVAPACTSELGARRSCRRGRCSAFPPAARAHCSGGEGVSAASRTRVCTRPPSPGPVPCSRGPFPAQGPAAAAGRAPRGGWAGVFNGSMLPAAGAAPGQAGPPARPQSPRSHQLQLQLRALRLPQSPAALTGKSPSPPGAHTWELLSLFPSSTRLHLRDTLIPRRSPRPSVAHCLGLCRLALRFERLFLYSRGYLLLSPRPPRGWGPRALQTLPSTPPPAPCSAA